jgi:hypothetical protein
MNKGKLCFDFAQHDHQVNKSICFICEILCFGDFVAIIFLPPTRLTGQAGTQIHQETQRLILKILHLSHNSHLLFIA